MRSFIQKGRMSIIGQRESVATTGGATREDEDEFNDF